MALYQRDARGGAGQTVDVALYEAVFALMEGMVTEYAQGGVVRERTGSVLPGIAPSNLYPTRDGKYLLIAGNGDAIVRRLRSASVGRICSETNVLRTTKRVSVTWSLSMA